MSDIDAQEYIDEMVRARGYVLDYHRVLAKQDFSTLTSVNALVSAVYLDERSLDRKTKELIFVCALTVIRASRGQIQSHIRAAIDNGATETEVLEAIEIALPEAGIVAFQEGFEAWYELTNAERLEPRVAAFDGRAQKSARER